MCHVRSTLPIGIRTLATLSMVPVLSSCIRLPLGCECGSSRKTGCRILLRQRVRKDGGTWPRFIVSESRWLGEFERPVPSVECRLVLGNASHWCEQEDGLRSLGVALLRGQRRCRRCRCQRSLRIARGNSGGGGVTRSNVEFNS